MKGIIFGAGSVGRGFIGELFFDAGMEIVFVDVVEELINGINEKNSYPHFTVYNDEEEVKWIKNARAISSLDTNAVVKEINDAEIIATSLGAKVLPIVAPTIAKAILSRLQKTGKAIDILLCENLHGVADYMRDLLLEHVPSEDHENFVAHVGFLATSIGRMIPVSSEEDRLIHPAAIKVEPYKFLPFDGEAIKSDFPQIPNLIWEPSVDFDYYSDRKLYIHNMGHCVTAYLAEYKAYEFTWQAIYDSEIRYIVRSAMLESAMALSKKYNQDLSKLVLHIDNLLMRFANKATKDTNERVGRDPVRKLKADDRLLGALRTCLDQGIDCKHLSLGVAVGLKKLEQESAFEYPSIIDYLKIECPSFFEKENKNALNLLENQLELLSNGFDFLEQIRLLDKRSLNVV